MKYTVLKILKLWQIINSSSFFKDLHYIYLSYDNEL